MQDMSYWQILFEELVPPPTPHWERFQTNAKFNKLRKMKNVYDMIQKKTRIIRIKQWIEEEKMFTVEPALMVSFTKTMRDFSTISVSISDDARSLNIISRYSKTCFSRPPSECKWMNQIMLNYSDLANYLISVSITDGAGRPKYLLVYVKPQ